MTRRQSNNQWSSDIAAYLTPKRFRVQKSAGKFLALIFWDQDGILLIDYLPKGQTINAEYYSSLLVQLKKNAAGSSPRGCCSCTTIPRPTGYSQLQCLDHPHYSPDLAPSEYHLFPGLKKQLKGRHFSSDTEVIAAAETWLDGQSSDFFLVACRR